MIDRSLLLIGWFFVSWLAIQTLPITRIVYHPSAAEISGSQVIVSRDFPMDEYTNWRPRLSYVETVRPLTPGHNGGQSCEIAGGPFRYSSAEAVGQWSIDWAAKCLDDPSGFTWSAYWHWHIGALRVGPVSLYQRVLRDPCQYKVSNNGTIHGPNSPHWAQTGTDRCFATRAEAEAAVE